MITGEETDRDRLTRLLHQLRQVKELFEDTPQCGWAAEELQELIKEFE